MPPKKAGVRSPPGRDTDPSSSHPMEHRVTSLPSTGSTPPGAQAATSSSPGTSTSGSPSSPATARASPTPPPYRTPAVPVRPPAFRPVPIQAPGPAMVTRSQATRSATPPTARPAATKDRAAAHSLRQVAPPVVPSRTNTRSGHMPAPCVCEAAPMPRSSAAASVPHRDLAASVPLARAATTASPVCTAAPAPPVCSAACMPQVCAAASAPHAYPPAPIPHVCTVAQMPHYSVAQTSAYTYVAAPVSHDCAAAPAPCVCAAASVPLTEVAGPALSVCDPVSVPQASGNSAAEHHVVPARRAASPASRSMLACPSIPTLEATQRSVPCVISPPPPRCSARDSPAMLSECYSRQGSDMSASSGGSRDDPRDVSSDTPGGSHYMDTERPHSPYSMPGFGLEPQPGTRPQRRPRSSDEEDAREEAKRYCTGPPLPQRSTRDRGETRSPTFAEIARLSPTYGQVSPTHRSPPSSTAPPAPSTSATGDKDGNKSKRKTRYPPLVVEKLPDWPAHFRAVTAQLGHPPNARPYQGGIRFIPESEEEYRMVQRYLSDLEKSTGLSWFSYSLPAEQSLKVAIRGLPAETDPALIEEELRRLNFEPEYVRNIRAREGRPGCIFYAALKRQPDIRRIYDTTVLLYMRGVKVEAWRGKRGPAQCHRCQKFRHSSQQCHRPLVCVRCGEGHTARDCPRPRTEPATCANCGGQHPASNRECPVFRKELRNRRAGTVASTAQAARPGTLMVQATTAEETEAQGPTLMAVANGPSERVAPSTGRRNRSRGGKKRGKKPPPPKSQQKAAADLAPEKAQVVTQPKIKKQEGATVQVAPQFPIEAHSQSRAPPGAPTAAGRAAARTCSSESRKDFTACAIGLLMNLIKAIREGQDPALIILDGLAALLALYNGQ